jgi:hypothetical protein
MSYCVNVITDKQLQPKDIFKKISDEGIKLMVVSEDFPNLRIGVMYDSLRGVEINKEANGYEVRLLSCSSVADYDLFPVAIEAVCCLSKGYAVGENNESIKKPTEYFGYEWMKQEMRGSWTAVKAMVRYSGSAVVMNGLFLPFCVGPKVLLSRDRVNMYASYEENAEGFDWLTRYFTLMQWSLADAKDTSSSLALENSEEKENPLGMSLITIKDNQLSMFDYVSLAPLMNLSNLDTDECIIIRFEDFNRSLKLVDYDTHFASFDEYQSRKCDGEVEVEEMKAIMDFAKRYVPKDLGYRPTYPGSGFDEKQNTFVLMWNPDTSGLSLNEYASSMKGFYTEVFTRKIHEWKEAKMDDRFYVVKVGDGKTGVVMAGVFRSQPYQEPNGKGRRSYQVELKPTLMINPESAPMLTIEDLEAVVPDFMWRGGYSGRLLTNEQAKALETRFSMYLKEIEYKDDGENICYIKNL